METIGFIGLGIMGKPMAKHLVNAGFTVFGYDVVPANNTASAEDGVKIASSTAELAAACSVIIQMLPTPAICLSSALGAGGVAENAKPGTLLVDMSSISPMTAKEMHAGLGAKGIAMMDCPVSGGEPKAVDGTLAIMCGGSKTDFERALPVFQPMSSSAVLVGDVGAGSVAKLANQIMVGVNIAAMSEALALAAKAGVDPALVYEAVRGGLAGSTVLDAKAPMVLDGNYEPGGRLEIHIKDFVNVLDTAHSVSSPTPLTASVMEMMQSLKANGLEKLDHSVLAKFYEMTGKVSIKRGGTA